MSGHSLGERLRRVTLMHKLAFLLAAGLAAALSGAAVADDWTAHKVRGNVFTFTGGQWIQVFVGDIVPDGQVIRTQKGGRAQFVRGGELVELGPETQVVIDDREGQQFTTVRQWYGQVAVDAQAKNVQHFAVKTPELAAVVKGTRFVVTTGGGESSVEVRRGQVAVEDLQRDYAVTVVAGQTVETGASTVMEVSGSGELPVVTDRHGMPVVTVAVSGQSDKGNGVVRRREHASAANIPGDDSEDQTGKGRGKGKGHGSNDDGDQGKGKSDDGNNGQGHAGDDKGGGDKDVKGHGGGDKGDDNGDGGDKDGGGDHGGGGGGGGKGKD